MKCLVLAGGKGERLWPLSRSSFPKQFIKIQKNHSLFQETIARNMAYCDEFIIVTNDAWRSIIENQMEAFHGVPYRCVFEEEPRKTTAAIVLACMSLQPSEYVFVVAADHLIGSEGYKETVLKGKEDARGGKIVLFGKKTETIDSRFGYIADNRLYEKPNADTAVTLEAKTVFQNIGLIIFQNGLFLNEVRQCQEEIFRQCKEAFEKKTIIPEGVRYSSDNLRTITPVAIEKSILEKTDKLSCIETAFRWDDIGSLEDLKKTSLETGGIGISNECSNTTVLNQSTNQAVVVNGLDDVLVVNTADAVYVGRNGTSHLLKRILHDNHALNAFSEKGTVIYRSWGYREKIVEEEKFRVQRVTILPGRTIYEHRHEERTENWTIIQGSAFVTLNGVAKTYGETDCIEVRAGTVHQISNNGERDLVLIETAVGEVLLHDMVTGDGKPVTEADLGFQIDPMVKLLPAFKDYLWGGTKLRDLYGKQCDYDVIAESWELSAHPAGNSIIASGRHRGLSFSKYLDTVGKEVLGWKCAPMQKFPLLIKFIDAKQNLSVQVHPNDDYALENENEYGKNEMWYVIDSEPGAGLYVGFSRDVSNEEVEKRVADNTILDVLNFYPTNPGDVFFIPAGTVHAIGKGNLICEIQQSSNSTYRLYDYDRRDRFGNPRELHLRKALDVLNFQKYEPTDFDVVQEKGRKKICCKYFEATILSVDGEEIITVEDDSFHAVVCIDGEAKVSVNEKEEKLQAGESIFVSAADTSITITGKSSLVITGV
jgi:mannose-1-phosphate guanylyltransferase/mannose-6-phosphate isomerase